MRLAMVFGLLAASTGCISTQIDETTPSIETLKLLRQREIPPIALGPFRDADGDKAIGRSINIRGSTLNAPKDQGFSGFLMQTVEAELRAAGKFDPAASTLLSATLIESRASENFKDGKAALGAELRVIRAGTTVFTRQYRVEGQWKSEFIGALAIPEAFRQYNALYPLLVRQAFADAELLQALKN